MWEIRLSGSARGWVTTRAMGEIVWHRRETRRQTEKTNFALQLGEFPAYSKPQPPGSAPPTRPHLRGPLGPWWGTDDFLGLVAGQGPGVHSERGGPSALIRKGDWRGSERICNRPIRTAGASRVAMQHFLAGRSAFRPGEQSVSLIGVSLMVTAPLCAQLMQLRL